MVDRHCSLLGRQERHETVLTRSRDALLITSGDCCPLKRNVIFRKVGISQFNTSSSMQLLLLKSNHQVNWLTF